MLSREPTRVRLPLPGSPVRGHLQSMSKKSRFEEDTKKEAFTTPSEGVDPKSADAAFEDIEIVVDDAEVEEEADRQASGLLPETD